MEQDGFYRIEHETQLEILVFIFLPVIQKESNYSYTKPALLKTILISTKRRSPIYLLSAIKSIGCQGKGIGVNISRRY